MKKIIYFTLAVIAMGITAACSSDDNPNESVNPIIPPAKEIISKTESNLTFIIKNKEGRFTGDATNKVIVEIIDNIDSQNTVFNNTRMGITMHMTMANGHKMSHSAPITQLKPIQGTTNVFEGELMFTMAGTEPGVNYWVLEIETQTKGQTIKTKIDLMVYPRGESELKTLQKFQYNGNTYLIAMHEIEHIKVGDNSFLLSVYQSDNHGAEFPYAKDFTIEIDPRMPTMANHGVGKILPPLQYSSATEKYEGIITFNMTGYWYINLLVKNNANEIIAGQFVEADSQINSDFYFEVDF
ncbi:hypothetical protein [Myroides indicus]|uniref:YtkA-like protein n=1 Tax=Myroides indicus TaxID=1323422 RepID=A0A4R7EMZ2_9FLAO|nr:hypothetical protein [Myroides indicus]TDS52094.1 hypothetical protein C8P70_13328 [Myroides indicus]